MAHSSWGMMGNLAEVLKGSLTGSPTNLNRLAEGTDAGAKPVENDEVNLAEMLKGSLTGSPTDLQRLAGRIE